MKWLESIVAYLSPTILLDGTPWKGIWYERERSKFVVIAAVWFAMAFIGYLGHYFFFDRLNDLQPPELWFRFRMSMATGMFLGFLYYISRLTSWSLYKGPALLLMWLMCYSQSQVTVWYSLEAWTFCFIFVVAAVLALRMNPMKSLAFACGTIATQTPALLEAGLPVSYLVSAAVVTLLLVAVFRTSQLSEVRSFLLEQENAAAQKQIIELNLEFAERVRAFIPKVIAERLEGLTAERRYSVLQASIEVLKPQTKNVACLFSDIRGFTQGSKELQSFVSESVLPEVRVCSDVVERNQGIPRKIGDLVFAYFDSDEIGANVIRALLSAIEIAQANVDMNRTAATQEVRRYILVSAGPAIVGNIGGLDSSMEITALGSPVNFLSRLDEATKVPALASRLGVGDVVVSETVKRILDELGVPAQLDALDLARLDVHIRDFPEETCVYSMRPTDTNYEALREFRSPESGTAIGHFENTKLALAQR